MQLHALSCLLFFCSVFPAFAFMAPWEMTHIPLGLTASVCSKGDFRLSVSASSCLPEGSTGWNEHPQEWPSSGTGEELGV